MKLADLLLQTNISLITQIGNDEIDSFFFQEF
jgi:hypothetical protein